MARPTCSGQSLCLALVSPTFRINPAIEGSFCDSRCTVSSEEAGCPTTGSRFCECLILLLMVTEEVVRWNSHSAGEGKCGGWIICLGTKVSASDCGCP